MSFRTVEVELENGRIRTHNAEGLPAKANALLTILEPVLPNPHRASPSSGLRRFLSDPDFSLTPEQFAASMEADYWEQ